MLPDWSGDTCVIIGCGPSANSEDLTKLRGRVRVIVVNRAWQFAPWADMLYACDPNFWRNKRKGYGQHALRVFEGVKVGQRNGKDAFADASDGLHLMWLRRESVLSTKPGEIGSGLNSGFQALNVGWHCGVRRFLLVGFDHHDRGGIHCHEDHPAPLGNPNHYTWNRWIGAWTDAEASIRAAGAEVINCAPGSNLNLFPKMPLDEALCQEPVS